MDMAPIRRKKKNKRTERHFYFALVTIPWGDHIPVFKGHSSVVIHNGTCCKHFLALSNSLRKL